MTHPVWLLFVAACACMPGAATYAAQPPVGAPVLVAGTISVAAINVATPVNKPTITFSYSAPATLVAWGFTFTAPHGAMRGLGAATVMAPALDYGFTRPKAPRGRLCQTPGLHLACSRKQDWTLTSASLTDAAGTTTTYNQTQLAALFPSLALTVSNSGKQSIVPPTISVGKLLNTTVRLSSPLPYVGAQVTVTSSVAGAYSGQLYLTMPNGQPYVNFGTTGPAPVSKGAFQFGDNIAAGSPTGTWMIAGYQVCDIVGNCLTDKIPADVTKLFGRSTFTVTN